MPAGSTARAVRHVGVAAWCLRIPVSLWLVLVGPGGTAVQSEDQEDDRTHERHQSDEQPPPRPAGVVETANREARPTTARQIQPDMRMIKPIARPAPL